MTRNRTPLYCAIGLLATLHMSSANATNTSPELIGVWRGTVGKYQVVACWDRHGGYYYKLQKPLRIALRAEDQSSGVWLEEEYERSETTISWQVRAPSGSHLVGTQIKGPKDLKLPIRLTRIKVAKKGEGDQQDCSFDSSLHDAFIAPRVAAEQIHVGEPISFMNKPYRVIAALGGNVASVELIGDAELVTKANELLRRELLDAIGVYFSCSENALPRRGDYKSKVRLRFRNDEWLSWSGHVEGDCGGAHPHFENSTNTIDLRSGKEVNLWDWFKLKSVKGRDDKSGQVCEFVKDRCLPTSLAKRVRTTRPAYEEKECKGTPFHEMVDGGYSMALNEKGIAFVPELMEPARVMRTCYANYTIPFTELAPYLKRPGLAAVKRILTHSANQTQ